MRKIVAIFTSDWHFRESNPKCRIDNYFETQSKKLNQIKELQEKNNCPIFDCGDLLDTYKISPYLEGWLIDNLPNRLFTIPGNHDLPNHRIVDLEKSSLNVLEKAKKVNLFLLEGNNNFKISYETDYFKVTGFYYGEFLNNGTDFHKKTRKSKIDIALVHEFISLDKFPGSITPEQLTEKLPGFDFIFCGHNHLNFADYVNDCQVINIGSMLRMDADQIDFEPGFYVMYEDTKIERILFNIEKNVIDRKYLDIKKNEENKMNAFVESLSGKHEFGNNFQQNLANYIKKDNNISIGTKKKIKKALD